MGSDSFVPIIRGRSSFARLGLFIHVTADLIDIGSHNQWTLQLHCVQPLRLYAGMHVGQVTFWTVKGEIVLYSGKYQGSADHSLTVVKETYHRHVLDDQEKATQFQHEIAIRLRWRSH